MTSPTSTKWPRLLPGLAFGVICALLLAAASTLTRATAQSAGSGGDQPRILSVQLDSADVVVRVQVPAGTKKITLESRTRLGAGAWTPVKVLQLDGTAQVSELRLTRSRNLEVLRVRSDSSQPLPAAFYQGTNTFNGATSTTAPSGSNGQFAPGGVVDTMAPGTPTASTSRTVVESDIWKFDGNTLYFFNQYRGLQVVDMSKPDAPLITGTLPLPASGEDMYVVDDRHVALLANGPCSNNGNNSQVLLVDVSSNAPAVVATVPIPGYIQESRLVGTALYVASQAYQQITVPPKPDGTGTDQWQWGTVITSIDLSDPATPVVRDTLWYNGYGNVIMATDQFLFVVSQVGYNWWQSGVHIIDISQPDGTMTALAGISAAGYIADKFKLNVSGDVLEMVSQIYNYNGQLMRTVIETVSLASPASPVKLGQLEVGQGDALYATRFDGDLAYIVTYKRVDPLWVVDLKDPANPKIAGQVQVPGYSSFIFPLGDRLVTVGIDMSNSWRTAVSLFDVHDPANPSLLDKVAIGTQWSWSEANYDEKAFTVLPDAGLVMLPYEGWYSNNIAMGVQLIDLGTNSLAARGVIKHAMQPRRATLFTDRVISISGQELLTVNVANRDEPAVTSDLQLSWTVNRLLLAGDYVIEIANPVGWLGIGNPALRVVRASDPDTLLTALDFTNGLPVTGATLRDGMLYVTQSPSYTWYWLAPLANLNGSDGSTNTATVTTNLYLSVFDLSHLPEVRLSGQTGAGITNVYGFSSLVPLWVKPDLLVWSGGNSYFWPIMAQTAGIAVDSFAPWPWYGNQGSGHLLAFDVQSPTQPQFLNDTSLTSSNYWWGFSQAFSVDDLIYVGHQGSEYITTTNTSGQTVSGGSNGVKADGTIETNAPPVGYWVTRYYMDVVDYADPANPTQRDPVNIPGALQGVAYDGALLYTSAPHWDSKGYTDWTSYLDASAYDGVSASLVASMALPNSWPAPLLVVGNDVLLGTGTNSTLDTWTVDTSRQFARLGSVKLDASAQTLARFGNLLVAQQYGPYVLFNAADPANLVKLGEASQSTCIWGDLNAADGNLVQGLWLPLGDYGVWQIPIPSQQ